MTINDSSITEHSFIKKEHFCESGFLSVDFFEFDSRPVTKLQAQNPLVLIDGLDGCGRDGIYLF